VNEGEARSLLRQHLLAYRRRSYLELSGMVGHPRTAEIEGASGTTYQVEVEAFWDKQPGGNVRVQGMIDDGGWRALKPLTDDFILAPNGAFVGEA
jgi:hypothetical protein